MRQSRGEERCEFIIRQRENFACWRELKSVGIVDKDLVDLATKQVFAYRGIEFVVVPTTVVVCVVPTISPFGCMVVQELDHVEEVVFRVAWGGGVEGPKSVSPELPKDEEIEISSSLSKDLTSVNAGVAKPLLKETLLLHPIEQGQEEPLEILKPESLIGSAPS